MSLIFDKETILSMQFNKTPNKVLVKPTRGTNEVMLPGGIKIYMDNRFGQEKHAPTTGIVVGHCGQLLTSRMPWVTINELQLGDYIVYSYESAMYAMDEFHGRVFIDRAGDPYFLIDYEDIFVVRREEQILPVNGYLLVSPIEVKQNELFTIVKENNNSTTYGTVEYIGQRNKSYQFGGKKRDDVFDIEDEISQGDVVIFDRDSDLPLEYSLHKSLSGASAKTFFRLQRKDIDAIIPKSVKSKFGF